MSLESVKVVIAQEKTSITERFGPLLQKEGLQVSICESGLGVLEALGNGSRPDVLLIDSSLQEPGAVEVCGAIKRNRELGTIPILMVETTQEGSPLFQAMEAGCDDVLPHPVNPMTLLARLRSLVRFRKLISHMDDAESILYTLSRTIEAKDQYTMGHADRVAQWSMILGENLGVSGSDLEILRKGGMLHDIGKIAVPDVILTKPGKYTDEEFSIMKRHPAMGCEICGRLKSIHEVIPLIRHHHERLDGSGYPDRIEGNAVPKLVRILTIVDIYDALRSKRAYKEAFDLEKSFQILWGEVEKGWWDKEVLTFWERVVRSKKLDTIPPPS